MTTPSNSIVPMTQQNGHVPDKSAARLSVDNLIRRELKVGNPDDPKQVAEALLARFKDNPKAIAISREAQGLPFLTTTAAPAPVTRSAAISESEWQQAINDVERDLQELTTSAVLKDITPELEGWAMAIRNAITEGYNAARFALDPRQRDKALGVRRNLGDYARLARLIGALTTPVTINYRKLAQSLDEVASVLLVMMGEALSNVGLNGGRYLLQVPYSELQIRRDAVIYALRNLTGSTQTAYDPNDWQRGLDAYRQLYSFLETYAQGDLRALLVETELMRVMDVLIQRSGQGTPEGLRQLGATARVDVDRLQRLVIIGEKAITPPSPPLTAFLDTLKLFIDAFSSSGGYRLLRIARPAILLYGLYGASAPDPNGTDPSDILLKLVAYRGALAEQVDRFAQSSIDPAFVQGQILLDKILYNLDRAIDLYAFGKDDIQEPEYRAVAYSYVINVITYRTYASSSLLEVLNQIGGERGLFARSIRRTLNKIRWELFTPLESLIVGEADEDSALPGLPPMPNIPSNATYNNARLLIQQELYIQKEMEENWTGLVETMAPDYVPYLEIVGRNGVIDDLMEAAIRRVGDYDAPATILPRDLASSWEELVIKGLAVNVSGTTSSPDGSAGGDDGEEDFPELLETVETFNLQGAGRIPIGVTILSNGDVIPPRLKIQTPNNTDLRLRSAPDSNDSIIIAYLPNGSYVSLTGNASQDLVWVEVIANNQTGWVRSEFLGEPEDDSAVG